MTNPACRRGVPPEKYWNDSALRGVPVPPGGEVQRVRLVIRAGECAECLPVSGLLGLQTSEEKPF